MTQNVPNIFSTTYEYAAWAFEWTKTPFVWGKTKFDDGITYAQDRYQEFQQYTEKFHVAETSLFKNGAYIGLTAAVSLIGIRLVYRTLKSRAEDKHQQELFEQVIYPIATKVFSNSKSYGDLQSELGSKGIALFITNKRSGYVEEIEVKAEKQEKVFADKYSMVLIRNGIVIERMSVEAFNNILNRKSINWEVCNHYNANHAAVYNTFRYSMESLKSVFVAIARVITG